MKEERSKTYSILYIILSFIFAIPSMIYLLKNKTVNGFLWDWTYLFKNSNGVINAILFSTIFSALFILYFNIIKRCNKIFNNKKQIFILIVIVSILFLLIIPYTSTDVYSYIANGWTSAHYKENPYYVPTGIIAETTGIGDTILNNNAWAEETVIYGPLWTMICTILSFFSFGNIDIALWIFKILNLIIHIVNCILIYKISKRDLFVILYGLNPFVLFETLSNVHNDIYIVFFVLLAIYYIYKKKNIFLSVLFIVCGSAIKYFTILMLPFVIIYGVKDKPVKQRIKYCIYYGIEFAVLIVLMYLLYIKDFQVLKGLVIQQGKGKQSIFLILYYLLQNKNILRAIQSITFIAFTAYYIYVVIKMLLQEKIKFYQVIRKYNVILVLFIFIVITNFSPWYVLWLFPTMFFLKGKHVKDILYLSYVCELATIFNFVLHSESVALGIPYLIIMILITFVLDAFGNKKVKLKQNELGEI